MSIYVSRAKEISECPECKWPDVCRQRAWDEQDNLIRDEYHCLKCKHTWPTGIVEKKDKDSDGDDPMDWTDYYFV